jgi:hypothetical protein
MTSAYCSITTIIVTVLLCCFTAHSLCADIKPVRTVDDQDDGLHVEVANAAAPMGTTDWKL